MAQYLLPIFRLLYMKIDKIHHRIYEIRDQKIMLDYDLANLYEVETRVLNQAVRRNIDLFPLDFMFPLSAMEWASISSQIVMRSGSKRPKTSPPLAFTEHGIAMLASILKSKKARLTSIGIIRAFIALKKYAHHFKELARAIKKLENRYNEKFQDIYQALDYLTQQEDQRKNQEARKRIGFSKI